MRRLVYALVAPVAYLWLRLWWKSCRIVAVSGAGHLDAALKRSPSLLPCYWHEHELFCARWLQLQMRRGLRLGVLVSPSVYGEVPAAVARRLGMAVIRGSSTRTGAQALRAYYELLVKHDISPIITPDGPTGPRQHFKPGALMLAQLSGRPLLPMAFAASRAWHFGWDRFVLPWPGARIAIAVGAPVYVDRDLTLAEVGALEDLRVQMEQELGRQFEVAQRMLAR
jgi:lysophospholipid acyltransferase (LPLAT)-like uncharacterized protein